MTFWNCETVHAMKILFLGQKLRALVCSDLGVRNYMYFSHQSENNIKKHAKCRVHAKC